MPTKEVARYLCKEKVDWRGLRSRYGSRTCGYEFEGMTPSAVRMATGRAVSCPKCGGIPQLVDTREIDV